MGWMGLPIGFNRRKAEGTGVHYAGLYARAVASGIDLMLLFLLLDGLFRYLMKFIYAGLDRDLIIAMEHASGLRETLRLLWASHLGPLWLLNASIQLVIIGILYVSVEILWGTTPGKWVLGLRVLRAGTLEPLSAGRYVLRFLAYIPSLLPLLFGVLWANFNREHRAWHDFIADTVVINTRPYHWYSSQIKRLVRMGWAKIRGSKKELAPLE